MDVSENITLLIGDTPLVRLQRSIGQTEADMLVKLECMNPGHSVKDRIALSFIEDAEKKNLLRPGGLIIEATSGNTGMGLALVAIHRGYRCLFTLSDKTSDTKINILRAMGAEVVVCPSDVAHDHPDSYCETAKRLCAEHENAFFPFQYDNLSNSECHYQTTAPELWKQTEGKITHLFAGVGTGGTMGGVSRYLKEKDSGIQVIGIEPVGSIIASYKATKKYHPEEIVAHYTEGMGSTFITENIVQSIDWIDEMVAVSDKDAAWAARRAACKEGLFVGWSCGAVLCAMARYAARGTLTAKDVVVGILPDHGSRYIDKIYNDDWMKEKGYWDEKEAASLLGKDAC